MDIVGGANCVLTAAVNMLEKYADILEFKKMPEYWHLETEIQPGKMRFPELSDSYTTETWENVDSDQLDNYDITICPRNRKNYLKLWFQQNDF
ncbi:hypothetical protein L3Y34_009877 [Caenorhabditis briggsae]|uniref:Uncharacterized protein n=1 Tax=Caenorhabditis briggsae TaxID=6238 RepID=A0AAE9D217_CAEBR|nr:hypothetical protein L3Y34_009877 [Caenorhabditis briggsae]